MIHCWVGRSVGGWVWWSRVNLSLSQDKKEVIERNVKLQTDLATAYQQVRTHGRPSPGCRW